MFCSFHVTLFNFLLINKGLHLFIWHWTYQSRVAGMFPSHAHPCQESLETWHLAHSPLCPASSYPVSGGPRSLCRRGRRALRWGGREPCCGRQQAGGQATTAGLAVASVSKLVLGRGKGQCDLAAGGRAGVVGGLVGGGTYRLRERIRVRLGFILALLPAAGP